MHHNKGANLLEILSALYMLTVVHVDVIFMVTHIHFSFPMHHKKLANLLEILSALYMLMVVHIDVNDI
jgi:hypothetical protein